MRQEKRRVAGETQRRQGVVARGQRRAQVTGTLLSGRGVPREGGERGLKSQLPTIPTIEGPLSTSPLTASVSHLQNGESE